MINRRTFLQTSAVAGTMGAATFVQAAEDPGITAKSIQLSSSTLFTGPLAGFGENIAAGAKAALNKVNSAGGINGRELLLDFKDDGYDAKRSVANIQSFLKDNNTFSFFCTAGTPANIEIIPIMKEAGVPLVAPYTGSMAIRKPEYDHVFHVRASYTDEVINLMQQISKMGLRNVGIVYMDNAFGKGQADDAIAELKRNKTSIAASVPAATDGSNAQAVAKKIIAAKPSCIFLGTSGSLSSSVFNAIKKELIQIPVLTTSVGLTPSDVKKIGSPIGGTAITRVFPNPLNQRKKLARVFQQDMKRVGEGDKINAISLETYMDLLITAEGLRRAGSQLSRASFINAMRNMKNFDIDGFKVSFSKSAPHVGSDYVGMGILSRAGKIIG